MPSLTTQFKRLIRGGSSSPTQVPSTAAVEHSQGLEVVYEDLEASLDIVAVHGLNGHREQTWTAANGANWLRDFLPEDLHGIRVLTWGYKVNTHVPGCISWQYLLDHGLELVADLTRKRTLTQSIERPIIFVAHGLGGLIVKSALIRSDTAQQSVLREHRSVKTSTYGIIYMGTPHQRSSSVQLGRILVNVASIFIANDRILKDLEKDSEWLQHQLSQYNLISSDFITKFAYETRETLTMLGHKILVVPRASAVVPGQADAEPIAIHTDHINMVKFSENNNRGYTKVSEALQIMAKDAEGKIRSRWETEVQVNNARNGNIDNPVPSLNTSQISQRYQYIPLPKNRVFTGRNTVINVLKNKLFIREGSQMLALRGLGGVGKTQVALQFAYWVKENKPEYSIFWVQASSDASVEQSYTEIMTRLDIQIGDDKDPKESVRRYLESKKAGKWLLVLDDVDEMNNLFGSDKPKGIEHLPNSEQGLTLLTTRSWVVATLTARADVVNLKEMSPQDAMALLQKTLPEKLIAQNEVVARELLQELEYLPLAIVQAIAYLNTNEMPIEKYLELLRSTEENMVWLLRTSYRGSQKSVATTWLVSFDQIRRTSKYAANLLFFVSCIETKAIPKSVLPRSPVERELEHAIGILSSYAFLVQRRESDIFDMHYLVHVMTRVWMQRHDLVKTTENDVIQHLAFIFPSYHQANRELWREYLPHALRALDRTKELQVEERYNLSFCVGQCLFTDRRFKEAAIALEELCVWRREQAGEDNRDQLLSEYWLANAYFNDQRIKEAIEIFEHVVAIRRKTLAEEDHARLASEHALVSAYQEIDNRDPSPSIMDKTKGKQSRIELPTHVTEEVYISTEVLAARRMPISTSFLNPQAQSSQFSQSRGVELEPQISPDSPTINVRNHFARLLAKGSPLLDNDSSKAATLVQELDMVAPDTKSIYESGHFDNSPSIHSTEPIQDLLDNRIDAEINSVIPCRPKRILSLVRFWVIGILNPPPPNFQRLRYTCGCGDELYVDVKELLPGGIEEFHQELLRAGAAVRVRFQNGSNLPVPPAPAFLASAHGGTANPLPQQDLDLRHLSSASNVQLGTSSNNTPLGMRALNQNLQYLLLCINAKNIPKLSHIEVGSLDNDEYLFHDIREQYNAIREPNQWRLAMLFPSMPSWLSVKSPHWLTLLPKITHWFENFNLAIHVPRTADFVQFQLVPVRTDICPATIENPSFPPECEVKEKRYHYDPCPRKVEIRSIPFFHEMLKPGAHLTSVWLRMIPKKLNQPLTWQESEEVIGWGIAIGEGLHWPAILMIVLLGLIFSGVLVLSCAILRNDASSAAGLGAYIVAIIAVVIPLAIFRWQDS